MKCLLFHLIIIVSFVVISCSSEPESSQLSYENLRKDGIISGFGISRGNPLDLLNRIQPIASPDYVDIKPDLYENDLMCLGVKTKKGWQFVPLSILNYNEIINSDDNISLCYCPLAGLAISVNGKMGVSGLLKYDTFLLYDEDSGELILPYSQQTYKSNQHISLNPIHFLTYEGILKRFNHAKIINPKYYKNKSDSPYGNYGSNKQMGIGHEKPGLNADFGQSEYLRYHPKDRVLVIGHSGRFEKAYPIPELKNRLGESGGSFSDSINGREVTISYSPKYDWAYAKDKNGHNINLAFSYIFSLYQHLPRIPIYTFQYRKQD